MRVLTKASLKSHPDREKISLALHISVSYWVSLNILGDIVSLYCIFNSSTNAIGVAGTLPIPDHDSQEQTSQQ